MTTLDPWQELIRGLKLAEEIDRQRPQLFKEYRLYYTSDGIIVGLWESDHPEGNYIVLDDPDIYHRTSSNLLRVVNGELKILDPRSTNTRKLYKSSSGQPVVRGHAAIALGIDEEYLEIEFYDQTNN